MCGQFANLFSSFRLYRFSDVQLAIEQRRKEMQEREKLKAENKRLLALEQQYVQSLERLGFEKEQLEQERRKLQVLQQQQQNVANQFDREISIQIEELELKRRELKRYEHEKEKLLEKEKEIELAGKRLIEHRSRQEQIKADFDSLENKEEKIELDEFERLEEAVMKDKSEEAKDNSEEVPQKESANHDVRSKTSDSFIEELDGIEEDLRYAIYFSILMFQLFQQLMVCGGHQRFVINLKTRRTVKRDNIVSC